MSATYVHLKLVCKDADTAKALKAQLSAFAPETAASTARLAAVFAEPMALNSINVDGVRAKAEVVSFDYQDRYQHGPLSDEQRQAWLDLGVDFVHVEMLDSQVNAQYCDYYHGLMDITAKEFKARAVSPDIPQPKKVLAMMQKGQDSLVAQAIQKGIDINALVEKLPLYVHAICAEEALPKTMAALAKKPIDWSLSLALADQYILGFVEFPANTLGRLLQDLLHATGLQLAEFIRHEAVWSLLLSQPEVVSWLCQQDGIDLNAPVKHGRLDDARFGRLLLSSHITNEPCTTGSILYYLTGAGRSEPLAKFIADLILKLTRQPHSETIATSIAILQKNGGNVVAPAAPSMAQRLVGYLKDSAGAASLEQLVAEGLSLSAPFEDGRYPLDLAERYASGWVGKLNKINALLKSGASAEQWLNLPDFQQRLQRYLFDATYRVDASRDSQGQRTSGFVAEEHIDTVLSILTLMATHGLSLSAPQKIVIWLKHEQLLSFEKYFCFQGNLLGAIALMLCDRHSELRPWCLPLVKLLLAHGALGTDLTEISLDGAGFNYDASLQLTCQWQHKTSYESYLKTPQATVLARLQQRQAKEGVDAIDQALIELLQTARHA